MTHLGELVAPSPPTNSNPRLSDNVAFILQGGVECVIYVIRGKGRNELHAKGDKRNHLGETTPWKTSRGSSRVEYGPQAAPRPAIPDARQRYWV